MPCAQVGNIEVATEVSIQKLLFFIILAHQLVYGFLNENLSKNNMDC